MSETKTEGPNPVMIIIAVLMVAVVMTSWAQRGGVEGLLEEGKTGSLFSAPLKRESSFFPAEIKPVSGQTKSGQSISANQISRGDQVYLKSPYYGQVKLSKGTAGANQPNDEYITFSAYNLKQPVNVTGWSLKNGKDLKLVKVSGDLVRYRADVAVIGKATKFFNEDGVGFVEDIILKPGEKVVVVTGSFYSLDPVPVKLSFKTNICTGYLENLKNYNFRPSLPLDCPLPVNEISNLNSLEEDCYRYLKSVSRCFTPEVEAVRKVGNEEYRDTIKGAPATLSTNCKNIIKENFGYQNCLDVNSREPNFEGKEWRVFINRYMPMYDRTREVITLFDREGKVVDQISY